MFAKKSEKALDKLINTPLIKLKRLIIKTQQKQNRPVAFDFIGDDSSVLDKAFNDLEMLLNSIEIQFEFGSDKKSLAILQKLSIELFQKTKVISEYINSFSINQKDFLVDRLNAIVKLFITMTSQNINNGNQQIFNYINIIYENYLLPSFRIIKKNINFNDQRILNANPIPSRISPQNTPTSTPPQSIAKKYTPTSKKKFRVRNVSKFLAVEKIKKLPVNWDSFDPDLLNQLIKDMSIDDPNSITSKGLPNQNSKVFKDFQKDDNNYK
jgi:hypothetical protein